MREGGEQRSSSKRLSASSLRGRAWPWVGGARGGEWVGAGTVPPRVTDIMPRWPEKKAVRRRVPTVMKPRTAITIMILVNHGKWKGFSCSSIKRGFDRVMPRCDASLRRPAMSSSENVPYESAATITRHNRTRSHAATQHATRSQRTRMHPRHKFTMPPVHCAGRPARMARYECVLPPHEHGKRRAVNVTRRPQKQGHSGGGQYHRLTPPLGTRWVHRPADPAPLFPAADGLYTGAEKARARIGVCSPPYRVPPHRPTPFFLLVDPLSCLVTRSQRLATNHPMNQSTLF
jgi:hypothetical protein